MRSSREHLSTGASDRCSEAQYGLMIAYAREILQRVNRPLRVPPLRHVQGQIFYFLKEGVSLLPLKREEPKEEHHE